MSANPSDLSQLRRWAEGMDRFPYTKNNEEFAILVIRLLDAVAVCDYCNGKVRCRFPYGQVFDCKWCKPYRHALAQLAASVLPAGEGKDGD